MPDKPRTHSAEPGNREERGRALAALAARQRGIVAARQLVALGFTRSAIAEAAASGRLHRLHRGVYAVGHCAVTWEGRCVAAVLACGPGAVASHLTAAWLWDLLESRPDAHHVTVATRRPQRTGISVHFGRLSDEDRAIRYSVPVTALPRTLLDLASAVPTRRLEKALETAERLRLFDLRAVESLLGRTSGHAGRGPLRAALAAFQPSGAVTRSEMERRFLALCAEAGLPRPSMNVFVEGYELDAYWQEDRFAVELDSFEFHRTRPAFERDRLRQENLKLAGIEMIRITWRRLETEPQEVARRIAVLLRRRPARLFARPQRAS